ncbi:MAG: DEAD/DEAH box helicase [Halolamina sp.]
MKPTELSGLPAGVGAHLEDEGIEELYPPQTEAVERGVADGENVVAAVPTASGKTLIAELAMLSAVERGGTALYIVPLRALASEKKAEFERWEEYGVTVGVSTGNYESDGEWLGSRDIIVATSEKVDSLIRNGAPWVDDLSCVVADEVHLVDDRERGPTLEVTLAKLRRINPNLQTVALSATVGNAPEIADWLDAELVDSTWRPIDLKKGVHYGNAINFADGSQREVPVDSGGKQTPALVDDTLDEGGSSLVFVNSRRNAESAATRLGNVTRQHLTDAERADLRELATAIRDVSDTATSDDLAEAVAEGAAFHHAGLCVTGDSQILHPNGTFDRIDRVVTEKEARNQAVGMEDLRMTSVGITDTFQMGKRPVLSVRTRTGNELQLSATHPLPVLEKDGVEWKEAGKIEEGEYVARPRRVDVGPDEPPRFEELLPSDGRVYREFETVDHLAESLEQSESDIEVRQSYRRDRNITIGEFRGLAEANGEAASDLYEQVIVDGGQKPVTIPERVNEDVCWMAGAVAGDGYVSEHDVVLTGKSNILEEFDRIVDEEFGRETIPARSHTGTPFRSLGSKLVADVFAEQFGSPRGEKPISLPSIGLPDEQMAAFVSGLFDADGSVSPRANQNGSPCVEFYSTSDEVITQLKTTLLRFGILAFRDRRETEGRVTEHAGRTIRTHQDVYRLTIYGWDQLRRFEEEIGFRHDGKAAALRAAIEKNPNAAREQNDVVPSAIGSYVRELRECEGVSLSELEPAVPKATLSRFERNITPMKRTTFGSLASQLDDPLLESLAHSDVFWDRIEHIERTGTEELYDLTTESSNFVANGIIAHNTSKHRSLVEDAFRDRLIKVIAATPTLAAGVNTPSRRVIVRDWRRYDPEFGGMKPLDTLEIHQMMGRAGRPGLDPYGEAVLLASNQDTMDELFERYVWGEPEPVRSKLAAEPALRTHLLATVASGFANSRDDLLSFLDNTLYAAQSAGDAQLASVTDTVLEYLAANEFIEREDGSITATEIGHTVSRLYLDPMSAATIIDGLTGAEAGGPEREYGARAPAEGDPDASDGFVSGNELLDSEEADEPVASADADEPDDISALGLYHLVSRTPDMYQLYLKSGDREEYEEVLFEREEELLGRTPSEYDDVAFEEWLAALKTARMLEDWAGEVDEDRITERYGIGPGDIRGKVDTARWLLNAAERLAGELDLSNVVAVREAKKRVEYGVREELLDLAGVRGVGRKRARRLFEAGIESRAALREADKSVVLGALRGKKTAESVLENVGRADPSMDGVTEDGDARRAAAGAEADDSDGQASLGDFE